jgi:hypothetical protein
MRSRLALVLTLVLIASVSTLAHAGSKFTYTRKNGDMVTIQKFKSQYGKTTYHRVEAPDGA